MGRSLLVFRASSLMLTLSMLQLFTGVFNAAFKGTLLAGWKQLLVLIAFMLVIHLCRYDRLLKKILEFILWASLLLIVTSFIRGVSFVAVFYNIFFYVAWVPFFIWAALGGVKEFQKKDAILIAYLVISCIGLFVDLKTDFFSFLNVRNEVITMDYLMQHGVASRAIFIFTASNLVMPVIGALLVIFMLHKHTLPRLFFCFAVMAVVILTSGSMNALLLAGFVGSGLLFVNPKNVTYAGFIIIFVLTIFALFNFNAFDFNDAFGMQIDRLFSNTSLDSDSNIGRVWFWKKAINDIGSFSFMEHWVGAGLGCTNSNYNSSGVLYTHGESSYLQAYTEGGFIGLSLRVLPFLMLFIFSFRCRDRRKFMILGYGFGTFIVYALAPLFGNVLSQMLLGMLVGHMYALYKTERDRNQSENRDLDTQPLYAGVKE